ncbi:glycoside hydrolase family protein [Niallia sp. FSL R7-0648]|uniref:lysozyme n=1 Tax=Niallia sp. FSL R7-0648 TaxID=2954521 RepID=UPI0030F6E4E3
MKLSNTGLSLIKSFEGVRLTAYKAVPTEEHWTIGYGHYGPDVKQNMRITQDQADEYFRKDVARFEKAVNDNVKVPLNQNQFDALVSFTYNCGAGALQRSDLLKLLNQGKYKEAADQFDLWNKSSGKVLNGLVKRRAKEKELFLKDLPKEKVVKPNIEKVSAEIVTKPNKPSTTKKVIKTYKVKSGDALSKLASKWGTTVKRLQELNGIKNPDKIYIGQTLKYETTGNVDNIKQYHTVVSGDNVTKIAKKYGTTVSAIKKLNPGIKNINLIYPKQKIRIK